METYDIAIVGGGPAGLSAALTVRARGKRALVISNDYRESRLARAKRIDNYPGMPHVSGLDMLEVMHRQATENGVSFIEGRAVSVLPMGDHFSVSTGSDIYDAHAVILATGLLVAHKLVGEERFLGRGVSYCATCDGMLYRGKDVVVVGLNAEAAAEANFLSSIGCHVTYLAKPGEDPLLDENVAHVHGTVQEINGDELGVNQLIFKSSADEGFLRKGEAGTLPAKGVFVLRSQIAPDSLIGGIEMDGALMHVDSHMATSIPGVFAAGDCVAEPAQAAKAVGEGQIAAWHASRFVDGSSKK